MSFWGLISGSDEKEDDERKAKKDAAAAAAAAEEKARQAREQALVIALIKQQQATQQAKQQAEQKAAQQAAQAAKEQQDKTFQAQDQAQQLRQQGEDQAKKILATGYPQQTQMQQNVATPSNFGFSQSQNKATSSQSFTSPQIARQAPQQTMETAPLVNQKSGGTQRPLNRYNSPQISGLSFGGS